MINEAIDQLVLPFRISSSFSLHAEGRWLRGGAVQVFHDAELIEELVVPKSEWTVLALLMEAAKQAEELGQRAAAFLPAAKLASELRRRAGVGGGELESAYGAINKLRKRLTGGAASKLAARSSLHWGRDVIESHATLGYRLSLRPETLKLVLLDERDC